MSRVYTDTIEPRKPTQDITLGTTGETITLPGNDLRVNTVKDKGGNTLWTSDGSGNLSSVNSAFEGNLVLLNTQTASGSASVSFTTGIDSTYDVYMFKFININPATDAVQFTFQTSTDGGSNYNITTTSTYFQAYNEEGGAGGALTYQAAQDQAQGTGYQPLGNTWGNAADECGAGELYLFAPSSTTYVKHYYSTIQGYDGSSGGNNYAQNNYIAGYFNTTTALNAISFKMSSGNFDGIIKMYGLL